MAFPGNWSGESSRKLTRLAEATLQQAIHRPGAWVTPLPQLRGTVRFVDGCARMDEPHFEIEVEPLVGGYHSGGGTWHRLPEDAGKMLRDLWSNQIYSDPIASYHVVEDILRM